MNANEITTDQSMGLGGTNAETLKNMCLRMKHIRIIPKATASIVLDDQQHPLLTFWTFVLDF